MHAGRLALAGALLATSTIQAQPSSRTHSPVRGRVEYRLVGGGHNFGQRSRERDSLVAWFRKQIEPDQAGALEARFIGNEAVALTDGRMTLVTDYPYQPGYSGYMTYDPAGFHPRGPVLLLVTHRHRDHFDPSQPHDPSWRFLGPREIARSLPASAVIPVDSSVTVGDLQIRPIPTPHANLEHYSYRVDWLDRSLYFVGDTEDPAALLAQRGLDVAFVTPWLWQTVRSRGARIDARTIVIYHHRSGESVAGCTGSCRVPRQGERWTLNPD
jgi:Beta-lactamase superfamily domain